VIKTGGADLDQEVHSCFVGKIFPRSAAVVLATEFVEVLKSTRPAVVKCRRTPHAGARRPLANPNIDAGLSLPA